MLLCCLVQALDAAVHWMTWMLQQNAMAASDLLPVDRSLDVHAATQLLALLNACSTSDKTAAPAFSSQGNEDIMKRLTYHGLQWLQQVKLHDSCPRAIGISTLLIADTHELCGLDCQSPHLLIKTILIMVTFETYSMWLEFVQGQKPQ